MYDLATIKAQHRLNNQADAIRLPEAFTERFPDLSAVRAEKYFLKYLDTVIDTLLPRLPFLRDGETHVSTEDLFHRCGEFRYKGERHWVWKAFKDIYPFMIVVANGSNLKATDNPFEKNTRVRIVNDHLLNMLVREKTPEQVFWHFYAEDDINRPDLAEVPIDLDNLDRFIGCTEFELERATAAGNGKLCDKLRANIRQAELVRKIGMFTQGETGQALLPMIPSPSAFGRTYYKGPNIQNVSREVRSAILGRHVQYDMNAAVFAIKLYLYGIIKGGDNAIAGTRDGSYTRQYLAEKKQIRHRLAKACFAGIDLSWEGQVKCIKNALTAIGFGAKTTGQTWMTDKGLQGTALSEILLSPLARQRFLADDWVKAFLAEQREIEDAILERLAQESDYPTICKSIADANGANGKVTRAGKLAYMYQQWETIVIDKAVAVLAAYGVEPLARIHDAFIVRDTLPAHVLDEIHVAWGLRPYLTLDCDVVPEWVEPEYKRALVEADTQTADHRARIERAEPHAALYAYKKRAAGFG